MKHCKILPEACRRGVKFTSSETVTVVEPFLSVFGAHRAAELSQEAVKELVCSELLELSMRRLKEMCGHSAIHRIVLMRTEDTLGVLDAEDYVQRGWGAMLSAAKSPLRRMAENLVVEDSGCTLTPDGIDAMLDLKGIEAASTMTLLFA